MLVSAYGIDPASFEIGINPRLLPVIKGISAEKETDIRTKLNIGSNANLIAVLLTWNEKECKEHKISLFPFNLSDSYLSKLDSLLIKYNQYMIIKLHPMYKNVSFNDFSSRFKRFVILTNEDLTNFGIGLYELLALSDILITDYSSVFIDFLIKEKPIIFVDSQELRNEDNYVLGKNHLEYMPGPIVGSPTEIIEWIETFNLEPNPFSKRIIELKKIWFDNANIDPNKNILEILMKKSA